MGEKIMEGFPTREEALADFFAAMPFAAEGLDWMLPAAVGLVVGIALSLVTPKKAA